MTLTVTCDLGGTQCHRDIAKPKGGPPEKWVSLAGDLRIDLCPPCTKHVKRQLRNQAKRST